MSRFSWKKKNKSHKRKLLLITSLPTCEPRFVCQSCPISGPFVSGNLALHFISGLNCQLTNRLFSMQNDFWNQETCPFLLSFTLLASEDVTQMVDELASFSEVKTFDTSTTVSFSAQPERLPALHQHLLQRLVEGKSQDSFKFPIRIPQATRKSLISTLKYRSPTSDLHIMI